MQRKTVILAVSLLALVLVSCGHGYPGPQSGIHNSVLNGTWTKPEDTGNDPDHFRFYESGFTYDAGSIGKFSGTYAYEAPKITINIKKSSGLAWFLVRPRRTHTGIITENSDGSITFSKLKPGLGLLNGEIWAKEGR
jgi:hypothetical protein